MPSHSAPDIAPSQGTESRIPFESGSHDGGNGLSRDTAVILRAGSPARIVPAEYAWIRQDYPGAKVLRQAVTPFKDGKRFDTIVIQTTDGREISPWFDITDFYK